MSQWRYIPLVSEMSNDTHSIYHSLIDHRISVMGRCLRGQYPMEVLKLQKQSQWNIWRQALED